MTVDICMAYMLKLVSMTLTLTLKTFNRIVLILLVFLTIMVIFQSERRVSGRIRIRRLQQPQEQRYPVLQVHAGSFRISGIHRTLTWMTASSTCVRDHSHACVYTQGVKGTPTASQHHIFDSEQLSQIVLSSGRGFEPRVLGSGVRRSTS